MKTKIDFLVRFNELKVLKFSSLYKGVYEVGLTLLTNSGCLGLNCVKRFHPTTVGLPYSPCLWCLTLFFPVSGPNPGISYVLTGEGTDVSDREGTVKGNGA